MESPMNDEPPEEFYETEAEFFQTEYRRLWQSYCDLKIHLKCINKMVLQDQPKSVILSCAINAQGVLDEEGYKVDKRVRPRTLTN